MKKIQLIILSLLACVFTLNAQEISFTFTANHTCEYAPLDSVIVENLTQGGDTVLYWNDTVLTILLTGVEMQTTMENEFYVSQNYPNPFSSQTKIDVFVPEQDDFTINVYDVTGRRLTTYENNMERGMHNFTFNAGNSNNYILTVNSTKYVQKKLMIRVGADDNPAASLTYNGIIPEKKSMQKSGKSNFVYEIGDNIEFSGYVDGDFASITDAPITNEDYLFDISNTAPDVPGAITGNTTVCENATSETYTISPVPGATSYTWTVPSGASITSGQGTTSITVNFGTSSCDVCVTASNSCGTASASTASVSVNPVPSAPTASTHNPGANQIVWNWSSVSDATGYKWNTTNNYSTATDMGLSTSKTETGLNCETTYTRYVWAYNSCGQSSATALTETTDDCSFICGSTLTINHDDNGGVAPVDKTVSYGTVSTNLTGSTKCWITQNLGASNQASSATDSTEASAGWYWQFNRKQGYKHDGTNRTPNTTWITPISEDSDWLPANDPCTIELGTAWRIPTETEWTNADANGSWDNYTETYASVLKLHAAGYLRDINGLLYYRGEYGYYLSSTQYGVNYVSRLGFWSTHCLMNPSGKAYGFSVRCLRD